MKHNFQPSIEFIKAQFSDKNFIPLHEPHFAGNEKQYLIETIDSTFVSSVGEFVNRFEDLMSQITGAERSVAMVNGTAALQVALRVVGVGKDDEVLTQGLTFVATANAITYNNAVPVFLDVDLDTMGLSPEAVACFLDQHGEIREGICYNKTTNRKIAACMPMHTFGFPVHLDQLLQVCEKWHIPLVEDAAESLGSYYKGRHTGTLGKVGAFSFNGNKIVTAGGGGAIISNDKVIATSAVHISKTAKAPHPFEFYHDELGYNYRMPNLNAALLCAQVEQLNSFIDNKRQLAIEYADFFAGQGINFRTELENTKANYWLMCVELENRIERDLFLKSSNENNVMTRPIWQLMHRLPMYKDCARDAQTNALFLEDRIVNIPSSVRL